MANPYNPTSMANAKSPAIGADKAVYTDIFDKLAQAIDEHDHSNTKGVLIPTAGIDNLAVTAAKLAADAVTTAKILDGNVTLAKLAALVASALVPTGAVSAYAAAAAPAGWVVCDGSPISRGGANLDLFNLIGTTFGVGDGATTFNVPNLARRVPVGPGPSSAVLNGNIGATGGEENHTLSAVEMPSHTHTGTTGDESNPHYHPETGFASTLAAGQYVVVGAATGVLQSSPNTTENNNIGHTHAFTTASAGSGGSHNNMQPSITLQYIIKL